MGAGGDRQVWRGAGTHPFVVASTFKVTRLFLATLSFHMELSSSQTAVEQVSRQLDLESGICEKRVARGQATMGLRLLKGDW